MSAVVNEVKEGVEVPTAMPQPAVGTRAVPFWKHGLDLACIALALPAVAPLMLLIAVFIKVVSRGPVFFRQRRVGLFGRPFTCLKFRTMRADAPSAPHEDHLKQLVTEDVPMTKMDRLGDPRLIPFGAWLRATGLDELPQLFNVLRREMSLVGPRPCTPYEYEFYLPWQRERFNTLPGLTGLWQVNGKNNTTFRQMIAFDIQYVRTMTFWLDLRIMARTLSAVLAQVRETRCR